MLECLKILENIQISRLQTNINYSKQVLTIQYPIQSAKNARISRKARKSQNIFLNTRKYLNIKKMLKKMENEEEQMLDNARKCYNMQKML